MQADSNCSIPSWAKWGNLWVHPSLGCCHLPVTQSFQWVKLLDRTFHVGLSCTQFCSSNDSIISNDQILDDSQRPLPSVLVFCFDDHYIPNSRCVSSSPLLCTESLAKTAQVLVGPSAPYCFLALQQVFCLLSQVSGLNVVRLQFWVQIAVQKQHGIQCQKGHLHDLHVQ